MIFSTKPEYDGKISSVGTILRNKDGYILLQKRTADAPTEAGKVTGFGGHTEIAETAYDTLKRELAEELQMKLDFNGSEVKVFKYSETDDMQGTISVYTYISDVDDTDFILGEGERIIKVKKLSEVQESDKATWLLKINDEDLPH